VFGNCFCFWLLGILFGLIFPFGWLDGCWVVLDLRCPEADVMVKASNVGRRASFRLQMF
jgi:hypothetical protein